MSDADDYDTEMFRRHHIDDAAIEAFFSGNGAEEELAPLAGFAEDLRSLAGGPVPAPSMQLTTMLAEGFSTEKGDLLVTAASNVPGPAPQVAGLPKWRKKKMFVVELLAGLSVAAKAAFGVGIAAASVTAAGAANVLPAPAQNAVSAAVEATTPFSFPDKAKDRSNFGGTVSTDARDGGVDGKSVSEDAKDNGDADENGDADDNGDADRVKGEGRDNGPAEPGQNGLDKANTTPAAGHVPTSVPSGKPATAGSAATGGHSSTGLGTASGTPAADHVPESVPVGAPTATPPAPAGSQSSTGLGTAGGTPAADHVPGSVPPAPRGGGRP